MTHTIRGWCWTCGHRHDPALMIAPPGTPLDAPGWEPVGKVAAIAHPSTTGCRIHGITRCTICFPACHCECNAGGFCGGCSHAGCGGRA